MSTLQVQVTYLRVFEKNGKSYTQTVTRSLRIDEDESIDIAQVTNFYVRYPWDIDHPMIYEATRPFFPWT